MLAHELIRRDIEIIDLYNNCTYSSDHIYNYTQYLKHCIYNQLCGKTVNKIVYVDTNNFFVVICAMIATWELGASLFLNDVDPRVKRLPYFKNFYKIIDVVVGDTSSKEWVPSNSVHIPTNGFLSEKNIIVEKFNEPLDQEISENTVCYYTTSSGTTGDPKLLPFTHYQTVTISNYIKNYLALDEHCRPYHFKTLHHSSLFNSYALPLLNSSQTHYCGLFRGRADIFLQTVSKHIKQHSLTHFLVPYNWIQNYSDIPSINFDKNLTLITIQGNSNQQMTELFNKFFPKQVVNYFGTSEIGTMFISRTTDQNLQHYNPNRFVDVTDFIDFEILDSTIKVKWKHLNEWHVIGDKIILDDGAIWHYGRNLQFSVADKTIELEKIQIFLHNYLDNYKFTLVPDYKLEKLYLNLYNRDFTIDQLSELNSKLSAEFGNEFVIADAFNFNPEDLEYGIKINGALLLFLFRQREKSK